MGRDLFDEIAVTTGYSKLKGWQQFGIAFAIGVGTIFGGLGIRAHIKKKKKVASTLARMMY